MNENGTAANRQKIGIIGGGISGLYLAWRLKDMLPEDRFEITIYEKEGYSTEPCLGGRIKTCDLVVEELDQKIKLSAELGAMRIPHRHQIISSLVRRFKLEPRQNPDGDFQPFNLPSLFYLRGKLLNEDHFKQSCSPYNLSGEELKRTPEDMLRHAILKAMGQIYIDDPKNPDGNHFMARLREKVATSQSIEPAEWMRLSKYGKFDGIRLRDIGFWNLLKHFLSSEAFLLCQDGFGFLSVISNWNASEAFKWLIADFAKDTRFSNVYGGMGRLVQQLQNKIAGKVAVRLAQLESLEWVDGRFKLEFSNNSAGEADYLVLALPPRSLKRITVKGAERSEGWRQLLNSSRPHRLGKIALVYQKPWWKDPESKVPIKTSGRVFTDLPMRQIYYFDSQWLAESGFSEAQDYSVVLIYHDSLYEGFWRTFSVYKDVHVPEDTSEEKWLQQALGPLPREITAPGLKVTVKGAEEIRFRLEEKIRTQLEEMHGFRVPVALAGAYKDWTDSGGWHTWEPFVDVESAKKTIVKPFRVHNGKLEVTNAENKDRIPLYVCGEAYAWEQGWIEGALMSAEALTAEFGETLISYYRAPDWINHLGWRDYMCPEFEACPSFDSFKRHLPD